METEKQFIEFVGHVFTLGWAIWAIPLSFLLSLIADKLLPTLILAAIAVVVHHVGLVAVPMLAASGDTSVLPDQLTAAVQALEPLSLAAEFVAYVFLIFVFSKTRQDMFRPGSTH